MADRSVLVAVIATLVFFVAAPAPAFDGEKELYEAAKKEKELTWYTAHYNTETAAAICQGFEKKYPGVGVRSTSARPRRWPISASPRT